MFLTFAIIAILCHRHDAMLQNQIHLQLCHKNWANFESFSHIQTFSVKSHTKILKKLQRLINLCGLLQFDQVKLVCSGSEAGLGDQVNVAHICSKLSIS